MQPLIRYDLGDRVTVRPGGCACGSCLPVIEVQGRCEDTLHLGAARSGPVSVLPLALSTMLEEGAGLFDFQLVQVGPCELLLRTGLCGAAGRTGAAAGAAGAGRVPRLAGCPGRADPLPQRRTRPRRPQRQGGAGGGIGALNPQHGAGSSRCEDNRGLKTPSRGRRHWELM